MVKETGGPAFPNITPDMCIHGGPGMSLRDYFAAKAMLNLQISCSDNSGSYNPGVVAKECYALADAMIAERNRN